MRLSQSYSRKYLYGVVGFLLVTAGALALSFRVHRDDPAVRLNARLALDTGRNGKVDVWLRLQHVPRSDDIELRFFLPDEISRMSNWRVRSGSAEMVRQRTSHGSGAATTLTSFRISADPSGRFEASYTIMMGRRLQSKVELVSPTYGFATGKNFAAAVSYLVPAVYAPREYPLIYKLVFDPTSDQPIQTLSEAEGHTTTNSWYVGSIVTGTLLQTEISHSGHTFVFHSSEPLSEDLKQLAYKLLSTVVPLFAEPGFLRQVVVASSTDPGFTIFPQRSARTIVLDLNPLTAERAFRFAEEVVASVLEENTRQRRMRVDEYWLSYALPKFFAATVVRDAYQVNIEQPLGSSLLGKGRNLETIFRESDAGVRLELGRSLGYNALVELDKLFRQRNKDLSEVVRAWFQPSVIGLSFQSHLALRIGINEARQFWRSFVSSNSHPPPAKSDLPLRLTPASSSDEGGSPVTFIITSGTNGSLELCGCKMLQAGGASRRATFIKMHRDPNTILVDLGDFLYRTPNYPPSETTVLESKMQVALMRDLDYSVVALGPNEIARLDSTPELLKELPVVSANIDYIPSLRRHGHMSLIGWGDDEPLHRWVNLPYFFKAKHRVTNHIESLMREVATVSKTGAGVVVFGRISPSTIAELVRRFPGILAVLSGYGGQRNENEPFADGYIGNTYVLFAVSSESGIMKLTGIIEGDKLLVDSRHFVKLDSAIQGDESVERKLDRFYNSPAFTAAASAIDGSDLPKFPDEAGTNGDYVGTLTCVPCHTAQHEQWKTSRHATAYQTLVQVRRNRVSNCIACHVVGYERRSGYTLADNQKHLWNVGCEVCHGPGSLHSAQPSKSNIVRTVARETCVSCHTPEHSDYLSNPDEYMHRVEH